MKEEIVDYDDSVIQTPAFALEKLLKKAVKPHSDVQIDSFSLVRLKS